MFNPWVQEQKKLTILRLVADISRKKEHAGSLLVDVCHRKLRVLLEACGHKVVPAILRQGRGMAYGPRTVEITYHVDKGIPEKLETHSNSDYLQCQSSQKTWLVNLSRRNLL